MIKFAHSIICSNDLAKARLFYCDYLGIKLSKDYGVCFTLEGDMIMIHDSKVFKKNIFNKERRFSLQKQGKGNLNIYFETNELNNIFEKVKNNGVKIIHDIQLQPWGQKVFRVYDPDGHIVEIGEPLWITDL